MVWAEASANWVWRSPTRRRVSMRTPAFAGAGSGHGRELHAQFVAGDGLAGGAVGEQFELFADAVFGLPPGAVEIFIESAGVPRRHVQGGDDVAGVGALKGVFRPRLREGRLFPTTRRARLQLSRV